MEHQLERGLPLRRAGMPASSRLFKALALAQGAFYMLTGIWPIVSIGSFQKVTGPKADLWLVKTVGLLLVAIGAALTLAGLRRHEQPEVPLLAVGSALSLTSIDVIYVAKNRIPPVYLLDAAVELALVAGWAGYWGLRGGGR